MSEISERVAALSPEERAALVMRLRRQAVKNQTAETGETTPLRRRTDHRPAPLSFAQRRLWFLAQMGAGSAFYNLPLLYDLVGPLDVATLERCLAEIVRRHDVLRTTFTIHDGEPVQVIAPTLTLDLPVFDLSTRAEAEQAEELQRLIDEQARRPFDLDRGPLIRTVLLKRSDEVHCLLLTLHHIIGDAWSLGIFMSELAALYEAFAAGRPSPLPELAVQYADYTVWQRDRSGGEALRRQLDYWKKKLAGPLHYLELPTDYPRPPVQTYRGDYQRLEIDGQLTDRLKSLSQCEGVTLYMTLLAAFKTLLHRYTSQTDILVGTPVAGRGRPELEPLIGLFLNTLVLRTDLSGDPSFRALLGRVREVMLEADEHQEVPFERLVDELQLERNPSHSPLFDVLFTFQNAPMDSQEPASGLSVYPSEVTADTGEVKFDLTVSAEEAGDGLLIFWEYRTDLFEHATIARMLGHFRTLLESATGNPDARLSELSILGEEERRRLLIEMNATAAPFEADVCVHELFERQAEMTPDAIALCCNQTQLTYSELNRRADRLARRLRQLGVGPETVVAVMVERSVRLVEALLGVLKAGGAYLPLDVSYPEQRLRLMMEDAPARVLLTQSWLIGKVKVPDGTMLICLDKEEAEAESEVAEKVESGAGAENLAYVIYTSGSTGSPKGVELRHRGLVNLIAWHHRQYHLTPHARATQLAGQSFDAAVWEIWPYLTAGASLHLPDQQTVFSPASLWDWLADRGITHCFLPTPLAESLLSLAESEKAETRVSLRYLLTGGDVLHHGPRRQLPFRLVNHYGPTENTVVSTAAGVEFTGRAETTPPIGRPITNTQAYILDARMEPVPLGVAGELHVAGEGLARGYLRRPALTAEKFVPNPFSSEPGARLYRTGDLGRLLADGSIEFVGRVDDQVKIRGFRIELGEIEAALSEHPGISGAAVVAREDVPGEKRLVAYMVGTDGQAPDVSELRRHLKATLPEHMVPSIFMTLEALPLNASGKIDRARLPAPDGARPALAAGYVAPRTALETLLAGIWESVLRVERIGVHDNFFELGGDSIRAAILINQLQEKLGSAINVVALFDAPTVATLAEFLNAHCPEAVARVCAPETCEAPEMVSGRIGRATFDGVRQFPLSFAQQRLWFIDQLTLDSPFYNIPSAFRLTGPLDRAALESSFNEIVRRHEALRTSFKTIDDQPVQVINDAAPLALDVVDLSSLPEAEREAEALRLTIDEAHEPFNLSCAPLIRARLLRLAKDEHVLLVTMHHIASDGWSMGVMSNELSALYPAFREGRPSPLAELPVQYADYAVWQRERLSGEELERQLDYWRGRLGGELPTLELPTDRPRPPVMTYRGAETYLELSEELTSRLKALSQREGVTLYMTLLSAFTALLHRYTSQTDILVGSPVAGRTRAETEPLIGFFVNTLVLRTDLSADPTFRELVGRIREVTLGAYAHQELPFEKLVEELQPERDLSRHPLFQVMFALQNAPADDFHLPGLQLSPVEVANDATRFDLEFHLWESDSALGGALIYNTDLFDHHTLARLVSHYRLLLDAVASSPDARISELPLLTTEERRLLRQCNDTRTSYPRHACVHELFERQAEMTPDAIALCCNQTQLTYSELNRRADRLARRLRRLGVGPETVVAVMVERSVRLVEALLGVLKAGGAYLPLDMSYPEQRLRMMMEDASARVLLTQSRLIGKVKVPDGTVLIRLDKEEAEAESEAVEKVESGARAENLAYVIYTSGSTGIPKGVAIAHSSAVALLSWARTRFTADELACVLASTSVCFDLSVFELFAPLISGGRVLLAENALALPGLPAASEVTLVNTVPSAIAELLKTSGLPPSVLTVNLAGEPLKGSLVEELYRRAPHVRRVYNLYGPSEDTTYSTEELVKRGAEREPTIGRPIANGEVYVLDKTMRPQMVGVVGELYTGGDGLARGYLNRPALTAERFLPHPFSDVPGARLYRTGDLGRRLADGSIEFVGRVDDQVKIRGFRIELGEIEAALGRHPEVREAIVAAVGDDNRAVEDKRLVAYVVCAEPARRPTSGELRSFLQERLPKYMIPSLFVPLDALPLNANGKVDRRRLPAPDGTRPEMEREFVAPRTAVEEKLADIWREVLGVDRVGLHDNFFELGGHSLLATRVVSFVRDRCGVEVPLLALFESPTLAGLASRVEADRPEQSELGRIAEMLEKLEQLSEEETRALLELTDGENPA
jgi:amino acid adenylation domain-containing protein